MSSVASSSSEYYEYNTSALTTDDDDNENDDDDDGGDDDDDDDDSIATGMSSGCRRSQSVGTTNAVTAKVASELYYHPQYHDHPHCPLPYR
mmetsp:Transcript_49377/g.50182  ORF Transcript_49377/g.50182 Transcript_49377/m.50182 type:complete len:91 (+) Transcript_49377:262-534(+)